jgi:hypothetical protein
MSKNEFILTLYAIHMSFIEERKIIREEYDKKQTELYYFLD